MGAFFYTAMNQAYLLAQNVVNAVGAFCNWLVTALIWLLHGCWLLMSALVNRVVG